MEGDCHSQATPCKRPFLIAPYFRTDAGVLEVKLPSAAPCGADGKRWGVYDMLGNTFEWCWDVFGPYPSSPTTDPTGSATRAGRTTTPRVIRGGDVTTTLEETHPSHRALDHPSRPENWVGFRVVRSLPDWRQGD